ncbi:hypothetical protein JCM8547_004135 [Rhodosporidiobolus lusitaniae]
MVSASSTASWQPLGPSSFYRSTRAYHLDSSPLSHLDLDDHICTASRAGGPIAVTRDPHKPVLVTDHSTFTREKGATVKVFSCAGRLLQTIVWDPPTPLLTILYLSPSFSSPSSSSSSSSSPLPPDTLILLTHSGLFRLYPLSTSPSLPAPYSQHSIPGAEENGGVREAKPAARGAFVVRFGNGTLAEVRCLPSGGGTEGDGEDGYRSGGGKRGGGAGSAGTDVLNPLVEPKSVHLAAPTCAPDEVKSWAVIPAEASQTRGTEVLLGLVPAGDGGGEGEKKGRVLRVDEIDCQEQFLASLPLPVLSLTPSPSGQFLALLTPSSSSSSQAPSHSSSSQTFTLHVLTSSLSRVLSSCVLDEEATGGERGRPRQVEWTGENAVAVGWERTCVVVGPFGETLKFFYPSSIHLTTEIDCVRVICPSEGCDLIEMVPQPLLSTLLPGSLTPSALLLTASTLFHQHKSPKADEYVRGIGRGPELREAVEECLRGAGREWGGGSGEGEGEGEGKALLQAAAFGKSFLEAYNPSEFVETTKVLRVLNAVRDWKVGVPLTWEQFHSHPPSFLIARLLSLSQHLLALRLSSFLSLPLTPVIMHWATYLIASSSPSSAVLRGGKGERVVSDEEVAKAIVDKLKSLSSSTSPSPAPTPTPLGTSSSPSSSSLSPPAAEIPLSPADLALTAFSLSRPHLARLLVEREKRVGKMVRALVRMGEGEEGLRKSVGGRGGGTDVDLVFSVLLSLRRSLPPGDLFRLIERVDASLPASPFSSSHPSSSSSKPPSHPGKGGPTAKLFELFLRASEGEEEGRLLRDFWYQDDRRVEMGIEGLREGMRAEDFGDKVAKVRKAQKSFAEDKESAFEAKMVDDHLRLLVLQQSLEQENPGKQFVGLSVNGTVRQCWLEGMEKKAEKVRKEFGVPEKRYWYITLRSLIHLRDYSTLLAFSKKKSPIGYEPFVEELIKAGAQRHAVGYVERCEGRNRVELLVRSGEWAMAGQECVRRGERGKLIELKSRAPNNVVLAQLDEFLLDMNNSGM